MAFIAMNAAPAAAAPAVAASVPPAGDLAALQSERKQTLDAIQSAFRHSADLARDISTQLAPTDAGLPAKLALFKRIAAYIESREKLLAQEQRKVKELGAAAAAAAGGDTAQLAQHITPAFAAPAAAAVPGTGLSVPAGLPVPVALPSARSAGTSGTSAAVPSAASRSAPSAAPPGEALAQLSKDPSAPRFEGVSFSIPQRKKLTLEVGTSRAGGVRAVNAQGGAEFGLAYGQIEHIFRLQVPEKMQAQDYFLAVPKRGVSGAEQMLWTANDFVPRGAEEGTPTQSAQQLAALRAAGVRLVQASAEHFTAAAPNPRKEASHSTRAHRGSKEGFIFFLETGVLFGFKKPVLHFALARIRSLSFTTVTKHTFTLLVEAPDPAAANADVAGGEEQLSSFEFSLIDQADFPGVQAYIERHSLREGSMDQRRAKEVTEPTKKRRRGAGDDDGDGEDEEGGEGSPAKASKAEGGGDVDDDDDDDDPEDDDFAEPDDSDGGSPGVSDDEDEDGDGGGGDDDGDDDEDEDMEDD